MNVLLDTKIIDGIFSLREAGLLIAYAFVVGIMLGNGLGRWSDIKNVFKSICC